MRDDCAALPTACAEVTLDLGPNRKAQWHTVCGLRSQSLAPFIRSARVLTIPWQIPGNERVVRQAWMERKKARCRLPHRALAAQTAPKTAPKGAAHETRHGEMWRHACTRERRDGTARGCALGNLGVVGEARIESSARRRLVDVDADKDDLGAAIAPLGVPARLDFGGPALVADGGAHALALGVGRDAQPLTRVFDREVPPSVRPVRRALMSRRHPDGALRSKDARKRRDRAAATAALGKLAGVGSEGLELEHVLRWDRPTVEHAHQPVGVKRTRRAVYKRANAERVDGVVRADFRWLVGAIGLGAVRVFARRVFTL